MKDFFRLIYASCNGVSGDRAVLDYFGLSLHQSSQALGSEETLNGFKISAGVSADLGKVRQTKVKFRQDAVSDLIFRT